MLGLVISGVLLIAAAAFVLMLVMERAVGLTRRMRDEGDDRDPVGYADEQRVARQRH